MLDRPAPATEAAEDRERMRCVQAGDEAAFAALMHRWERPVKSVIGRIVLNARDAEDLAQETFVRLWQQREKYRPEAEFRPWLFAIAVNLARNRLRWWRSRPEVALEDWDQPDAAGRTGGESAEQAERARAVRDALARLPADQREALVLFEYEEMSQAEIAAVVGATPKAVENRIARARERLRGQLARWL
ncbi:MAG TPA: sigma-70 family RNA polymerase sigma factor [Opitutaceae bacterium]|nr:sigma-70 family RNA polymerase sigma factor [Opitutaceae bacterium]